MRAHAAQCAAHAAFVASLPRHRAAASPAQGRLGAARGLVLQLRPCLTGLPRCPTNGTRCTAFFNFRQDSKTAGIVGAQGRNDYDRDDVEQYFNYMGCLAVEGTYDRMYALLNAKIPAIDIILLFAAAEGDLPKIEEICNAGADVGVKDLDGNTPLALAGKNNAQKKEDTIALLQTYAKKG